MSMVLWLLAGALLGAAIVIYFKTDGKVTRSNLFIKIREALASSNKKRSQEMLARVLQANIEKVSGNVITIDCLEMYGNENKEPVRIQLTCDEVGADIYQGSTVII